MDSGDLLAKGLDKTELRIERWLDIVAMVVMGSDGIGKGGRIGRECDSRRGKSAGRNGRRGFWTRKRTRNGAGRDSRRG